jgi:hypothetical protein
MISDLLGQISFDPLLARGWLIVLAGLIAIAALAVGVGRLKSYLPRLIAGLCLLLALLNPQRVSEDRQARSCEPNPLQRPRPAGGSRCSDPDHPRERGRHAAW